MKRRLRSLEACAAVAIALTTTEARAQDAGSASAGGCVESVRQGGRRPDLKDELPKRGTSGYVATLSVTVEHGKGESVLPQGLELQSASETAKELRAAGWVIPDQDGGAGARIAPSTVQPTQPERASTTFELPLVALPEGPGRHLLVLPPLPIAVARANGEIMTVCTRPHSIVIEDPIASTNDPQPQPNPPGRPQREEWTALKRALEWSAVGLAAGALAAYAIYRWMKRPKVLPPPPPPRPAWDVALEELDEVRHAGLIEVGRFGEHFDRVNDTLRRYLGARFGFDGLESTTDETLAALQRAQLVGVTIAELTVFLQECDLVKFANLTPSHDDCAKVLESGERIVRQTMPRPRAFAEGRAPL